MSRKKGDLLSQLMSIRCYVKEGKQIVWAWCVDKLTRCHYVQQIRRCVAERMFRWLSDNTNQSISGLADTIRLPMSRDLASVCWLAVSDKTQSTHQLISFG